MKFTYDSEGIKLEPAGCAFENKWALGGVTTRTTDGEIHVNVDRFFTDKNGDQITPPIGATRAAFAHEVGHSQQFADPDFNIDDLATDKRKRFWLEVNAWERMVPTDGIDQSSYTDAWLILDALNTYRRALDVNDGDWFRARAMVESWFETLNIDDYEPLEPDPDDAQSPDWEELSTEPFDGEADDDEKDEREADGGSDREDADDYEPPDDKADGNAERDAWLYTPDGMQATKSGRLENILQDRGWNMKDLPPLTRVLADLGGAKKLANGAEAAKQAIENYVATWEAR